MYHRILNDVQTSLFTTRSGKTIQLRTRLIIIYIRSFLQFFQRSHRIQFHFLSAYTHCQFLRLRSYIDTEMGTLTRYHSFERALHWFYTHCQVLPLYHGTDMRSSILPRTISFRHSIVVVFRKIRIAARIKLIHT